MKLIKVLKTIVVVVSILAAQFAIQIVIAPTYVPISWKMLMASVWQYAYIARWGSFEVPVEEVERVFRYMDTVELPFVNITEDYYYEGSWEEFLATEDSKLHDKIVIVRGFLSEDEFDVYKTAEGFKSVMNNTKHHVQRGESYSAAVSRSEPETMLLHEMVDRMMADEKIYGGFITTFGQENPGLHASFSKVLERLSGTIFDEFSNGK
jgi:hypothetical protein